MAASGSDWLTFSTSPLKPQHRISTNITLTGSKYKCAMSYTKSIFNCFRLNSKSKIAAVSFNFSRQVQAYIISALRKEMPSMFGKDTKKKELIKNLGEIYAQIQRDHQISMGDFPNMARMKEQLQHHDFTKFHTLKPKLLEAVDYMLANDIARLMQMIPNEEAVMSREPQVKGGAFDTMNESMFGYGRGEGVDAGRGEHEWIVEKDKYKYDESFDKLNPVNGKITGAAAKSEMVKSKLPNSVLGKIWKLSDIDKDGMLDADEWALANHLIQIKLDGHDLPSDLPEHLIPDSKKKEPF